MILVLKILSLCILSQSFAGGLGRSRSYPEVLRNSSQEYNKRSCSYLIRPITSPSQSIEFQLSVGSITPFQEIEAKRSSGIDSGFSLFSEQTEYRKKPLNNGFPDIFKKPSTESSLEERLNFYRQMAHDVEEFRLHEKMSYGESLYISCEKLKNIFQEIRKSNYQKIEDLFKFIASFKDEFTEKEFKKCEYFCRDVVFFIEKYPK